MKRATTSLPVPDSPVSSTVVSVAATCVALLSTRLPFQPTGPTMSMRDVAMELGRRRSGTRVSIRSAPPLVGWRWRRSCDSRSCDTATAM